MSVCGRGGVRIALIGLVGLCALSLGGCLRDPYVTSAGSTTSSAWRIATQPDRITGAALPSASLTAMASNTYASNPKPAIMQLTCFDGRPLVRFAFEFKIRSDVNTVLGYRFDEKPGRDSIPGARFLQQHQTVLIEERADVAQFVADMRGAKSLYARIRSITEGRSTAEFKLEGAEAALDAAFVGCPPTPDAPAASPRRRVS